MKSKNLIIWGAVLIVVAALIIVSEQLNSRKPSEKALSFFPGLTEAKIQAVLIAEEKDTTLLRKQGDVWVVYGVSAPATSVPADSAGRPASVASAISSIPEARTRTYSVDSASVASLIEKICGMKKEQLISTNPDKQSTFEVDTSKGTLVRVWENGVAAPHAFIIGKNGPSWSNHYVRMVGSNNVYTVGGSIKYAFFADLGRWKDKSVLRFNKSAAKKLALVKKDGPVIVVEKSQDSSGTGIWNIVQPETARAKSDVVDNVLNELSAFNASEWEEDTTLSDSTMGFTKPELVATVNLDNGETKEAVVGTVKAGDNKLFWVRARGREKITFLVSDWSINNLDKNVGDFKGTAATDTTHKAAEKVETKKPAVQSKAKK